MADTIRSTQEVVEALGSTSGVVRSTQTAVEVLHSLTATVGVTQTAVEVLVPSRQGTIFSGSIDEVKIFSSALTAGQIVSIKG